ncbi:aminotransferase V [[Phormidium ambiguum] IAM M-71]|uniref:Aminotransferase V n=1 Tax=[Phormidium ambiguum] IAM M-71 TaxID=454136 RepID=A0A1U7IAD5_9CYAN|nr:aminotransferase class V-fold PLP-dependent enzyme [Phormidium ambiguum]OKH33455.1 aminotransferase V [Phormidium ambiguum IAM M-71]
MWSRRNFLISAGLGATATTIANSIHSEQTSAAESVISWKNVRSYFNLDPNYIHVAGLLIATHPLPVHNAIEEYRSALNENPAVYVQENNPRLAAAVRQAAANYMGTQPNDIAITDSTTMGTGLVINGLQIRPDQEMLISESDYYSTRESLRYKAARTGATIQTISLFQDLNNVSEVEIVDSVINAIRPQTRLVAATWVHSSTGLKVPIRQIGDKLTEINSNREESDRIIFFVDGVHGFGVENVSINDLNCDFFSAGTHKWMFAPRGTGIIWGNPRSQAAVTPTIPTFSRGAGWGGLMSPGGYKPFEHLWAMAQAFEFHQQLGKAQITEHIHKLSQQLKEGLAKMSHVILYTPISQNLSAGIVCFDINGMTPGQVVEQLRQRNIIATKTPYSPSHARLTPGIYNTPEQMEQVLRAVSELG